MRIATILWPLCLLSLCCWSRAQAEEAQPVLVAADLTLDPDVVYRGPLVLQADHVVIDGRGALLQGPGEPGRPETYQGVGILAVGCSNVTLRNLRVSGFEIGLAAQDGRGWTIENCDFSGNFHDPDRGWGDGPRAGGLILTRMSDCLLRHNVARDNWNGLDLLQCHRNEIVGNDFSHCSNVCLKLYTACANRVSDNDLSYGLRIDRAAGEVHARDSTCVLIESGSDDNVFVRNDITHGGDGVFIRVLNGWVSRGNLFVENDCSYANNNCFEAWSPGNTYLRNKANHGSYGFWLGGSDQTVLIGNEAAYNGQPDGFHNAPEPCFAHGGIVCVGGSGSHSLIAGNHVHHNYGGGIVFRGDVGTEGQRWRIEHWVVQQNLIEHNVYGLWGRWADGVFLGRNTLHHNQTDESFEAVTNLVRLEGAAAAPSQAVAPQAVLAGPLRGIVGEALFFDARASRDSHGQPLEFFWRLGDGSETDSGATASRTFDEPGFYRVGLTVANGGLADLAHIDLLVTERIEQELGTEPGTAEWSFACEGDPDGSALLTLVPDADALFGRASQKIVGTRYPGLDATAICTCSAGCWDLSGKTELSFWLRAINPDPTGWQDAGPLVQLDTPSGSCTFAPGTSDAPRNYLREAEHSESRWLWSRLALPLAGGPGWTRTDSRAPDLSQVQAIRFTFDSWGAPEFVIWLDGLAAR